MNDSILIIDDEPQLRRLLRITLQFDGYTVREATTADEGVQSAARNTPDLILLDIGLPDKSGHDVLKHLREWFNRPVIIISERDNSNDIIKAFDNGANDYVVKPFRNEDLVARMRAAIRNHRKDKNVAVKSFGEVTIDYLSRSVSRAGSPVKLTSAEYQFLCLFAQNESRVLTHQFLLSRVLGQDNESDVQYVHAFVCTLRSKLERDPNRPVHFLTESGVGYRFVGDNNAA